MFYRFSSAHRILWPESFCALAIYRCSGIAYRSPSLYSRDNKVKATSFWREIPVKMHVFHSKSTKNDTGFHVLMPFLVIFMPVFFRHVFLLLCFSCCFAPLRGVFRGGLAALHDFLEGSKPPRLSVEGKMPSTVFRGGSDRASDFVEGKKPRSRDKGG